PLRSFPTRRSSDLRHLAYARVGVGRRCPGPPGSPPLRTLGRFTRLVLRHRAKSSAPRCETKQREGPKKENILRKGLFVVFWDGINKNPRKFLLHDNTPPRTFPSGNRSRCRSPRI